MSECKERDACDEVVRQEGTQGRVHDAPTFAVALMSTPALANLGLTIERVELTLVHFSPSTPPTTTRAA